jgi:hypothetical protein
VCSNAATIVTTPALCTDCRVFPFTIAKIGYQLCCCDCRVALPMDDNVPFGCGICGHYFAAPAKAPSNWSGERAVANIASHPR